MTPYARPAFVDGTVGLVVMRAGRVSTVPRFTVVAARVVAIDIGTDPGALDIVPC